jgi:hypothetical protein
MSGSLLAFHVNVAPHAVLDHSTRIPAMALTQFIRILLLCFSRAAGTPFPEKLIPHVQESMSDCSTGSVIRGELEEENHSPLHCGNYARRVPSQEEDGQNKNHEYEPWERKIDGDVQGDCRRLRQIAESILAFFGG